MKIVDKLSKIDLEPVEILWDLPAGWRWERLGNLVVKSRGKHLPDKASTLKFVGLEHILPHQMRLEGVGSFANMRSAGSAFIEGDILYGRLRPYLNKVWVADCAGACSGELIVLKPKEGVNARYIALALHSQRYVYYASHIVTGDRPRIDLDLIGVFPVPIPDNDIQGRIVARIDDLFAEIDEGEAALAEARAGVETYRKALLKAAVTGELTADWREANPPQETGEDLLQRILADRRARWHADPKNARKRYTEPAAPDTAGLPELPEGWTWVSLDQLGWSAQYGTSQKCSYEGVGEPVLRIPNLRAGSIDLVDMKRSLVPLELDADSYVGPGDLLIVRTNGSDTLIGRAGITLVNLDQPTFFASYLIRYRLTGDQKRWRWIRAFSESAVFRDRVLASIGSSAGQYNLSMGKLDSFPIALPPESEIDVALSLYAQAHAQVPESALIDSLSAQTSTLRQSILSAAFRGELVA